MVDLKRPTPVLPVLTALLALVLTGCQLRLAGDVAVAADGSGTFEYAVAIDRDLRELLESAGVDLERGFEQAAEAAGPAWDLDRSHPDGGLEVRVAVDFADPEGFERAVEELQSRLGTEDGGVLEGVTLEVDDDGAARFSARAGLLLPSSTGAEGDGVTFDGEDLARLVEERGDEFVRYDLRLTLPGDPLRHDADVQDGRTLVWHLPAGRLRDISATSAAAAAVPWLLLGAVLAGSAVVAAVTVVVVRRRGRDRATRQADRSVA